MHVFWGVVLRKGSAEPWPQRRVGESILPGVVPADGARQAPAGAQTDGRSATCPDLPPAWHCGDVATTIRYCTEHSGRRHPHLTHVVCAPAPAGRSIDGGSAQAEQRETAVSVREMSGAQIVPAIQQRDGFWAAPSPGQRRTSTPGRTPAAMSAASRRPETCCGSPVWHRESTETPDARRRVVEQILQHATLAKEAPDEQRQWIEESHDLERRAMPGGDLPRWRERQSRSEPWPSRFSAASDNWCAPT
jgi:hypothetical protein